jgi:CHAT domain-containing protein
VVESVRPLSGAELSGFQPGDLLLRWTFRPRDPRGRSETGTLSTPFDLTELFLEKVPRGELTFEGSRQGQPRVWTYRSTGSLVFGLGTRPVMADGSPRLEAWSHVHSAETANSDGCPETADRELSAAERILLEASDPAARVEVLWVWADQLDQRQEPARAVELYREAVALERQRQGDGLSVAFTLGMIAFLLDREGNRAESEEAWLERLAILEKLAPDGLEVARTLDFLGYLALWRGDLAAAQQRLYRAEALQRPVLKDTFYYAGTLAKLSIVAEQLGDLEREEDLQRQVLALNSRWAPGSPDYGGALMNLATTLIRRGEVAAAEELLHQSVEMIDKPGIEPRAAAGPQINLGEIALYRGDLAAAQSYFELALKRLREGAESVELTEVYAGLAEVARKQRRFAEARSWETSALAITERLTLGDLGRAGRLQALARIEREGDGDLSKAEALLRQAEALVRKAAPESLQIHAILRDLGRVLVQEGRLAEAEALYRQILSSLERRDLVGTKDEAEIRNLFGDVERRRGNVSAAEENLCQATRILDAQRSHLGGDLESRSWFESETQSYAFDCLSALMEQGKPAEAFHALERGKTRVFLELLAERDLRFAGLSPELKSERARLDAEYDRLLTRLSESGTDERAMLRARLEDIKAAREALVARLRLQAPRFASLQAPAPLDLTAARRALDPGTALLAYAVGPEKSYLFVVRPGNGGGRGLEVHRLPIGRAALEKEIEAYRRLLTNPQSDLTQLNARAASLYDLLLKPAEKKLARAQRILISADGPLHLLPWAALRRHGEYLAQWRPLHLIASATLYEEIRQGQRRAGDPGTWRLVAFGDPIYPEVSGATGETITDSEIRSTLRRGLKLEPLPSTRDEVRQIAGLFPGAEVYLGAEATEERAKEASPRADLLHFAGHGLINERFPLDSALALSIPTQLKEGQDNGLLQAWEIFESLHLDANLVTLSACDTALGREMGGEGLLGLTRAFQFAGARTVLASLWSVSDVSTATLMKRFYTYLRQGRTKDEALRAAQLDLIRSQKKEFSHPYHWAGFSLYGDWR